MTGLKIHHDPGTGPRWQPARLCRGHRLFIVAAAVSLLPRLLAMLAYRPALFTADSFAYLSAGARPALDPIRPAGYPFLL